MFQKLKLSIIACSEPKVLAIPMNWQCRKNNYRITDNPILLSQWIIMIMRTYANKRPGLAILSHLYIKIQIRITLLHHHTATSHWMWGQNTHSNSARLCGVTVIWIAVCLLWCKWYVVWLGVIWIVKCGTNCWVAGMHGMMWLCVHCVAGCYVWCGVVECCVWPGMEERCGLWCGYMWCWW